VDLFVNRDSALARSQPLSTSATRFGHPLNDNNHRRYIRKKTGADNNGDKKVSARGWLSLNDAYNNIDCRSLFWKSLDLWGFRGFSECVKFRDKQILFERYSFLWKIFVSHEEFYFLAWQIYFHLYICSFYLLILFTIYLSIWAFI